MQPSQSPQVSPFGCLYLPHNTNTIILAKSAAKRAEKAAKFAAKVSAKTAQDASAPSTSAAVPPKKKKPEVEAKPEIVPFVNKTTSGEKKGESISWATV